MKIAVCISGQPRAYDKAYEYLSKNLLNDYEVDIFFHTWENNVYETKDVVDLYKPKSYNVTKSLPKEFASRFTNIADPSYPAISTVSSYYSLFQASKLRIDYETEHGQYDFVVKTRFDYALNGKIPFDQLQKDRLYIPDCRMVPTRDFGNDQFAFGSSIVMTEYMNTYLYLNTFYELGVLMNGEDMMRANLHRSGLVGERLIYVNMNNPFPPGPYNGTTHSLIRDDMDKWK